jgi:hypothetical protein
MNEDFSRVMRNLMVSNEEKSITSSPEIFWCFMTLTSFFQDYYSHNPNADKLNKLKGEVDEVKTVMVSNIGKALFFDQHSI